MPFYIRVLIVFSPLLLFAETGHAQQEREARKNWSEYRAIQKVDAVDDGIVITLRGNKISKKSSCSNKFKLHKLDPVYPFLAPLVENARQDRKNIQVRWVKDTSGCNVLIEDLRVSD